MGIGQLWKYWDNTRKYNYKLQLLPVPMIFCNFILNMLQWHLSVRKVLCLQLMCYGQLWLLVGYVSFNVSSAWLADKCSSQEVVPVTVCILRINMLVRRLSQLQCVTCGSIWQSGGCSLFGIICEQVWMHMDCSRHCCMSYLGYLNNFVRL